MTVTVEDLAEHLGFAAPPADPTAMQRVLDSAYGVINPHLIATAQPYTVEQSQTYDLCILRAASELWRWKDTSTGDYGFPDGQDFPRPVFRDVFYTVRPTLAHAGLVAAAVFA